MVEAYVRFGTLRGIFGREVEFEYKGRDNFWHTERLPLADIWSDEAIEDLVGSLNEDFDFYVVDGHVTEIRSMEE